jgi:2-amino-4-hydroxy-6-hydroxymethyldihydropteridine diphosphokinase
VSAVTAYVGLGSNLPGEPGDPRAQLGAAFDALARLPGTRLAGCSSLYRSAPLGHEAQPDFVNAVARLQTRLAPLELLAALQEIERRHGRERPFPNAPRTLDLDLLLFGDLALASAALTLPHPRMHERAFVLRPLAELDPEVQVPGRGRAVDLLARCTAQRIERL